MGLDAISLVAIVLKSGILEERKERTVQHDSVLTGQMYLRELLNTENAASFKNVTRMDNATFYLLQNLLETQYLRTGGLQNTKLLVLSDPRFVICHVSSATRRQITNSVRFQFCHILVCYAPSIRVLYRLQNTYCSCRRCTTNLTIIYIMKFSAAPSHTNSSVTKKSKISQGRPAPPKSASQAKLAPKPVKYVPPPLLTAKQQKSFHWLLSGASYISVLEGSTMNAAKIFMAMTRIMSEWRKISLMTGEGSMFYGIPEG